MGVCAILVQAGCDSIFAPPELPAELRFVTENSADFRGADMPIEIVGGAEISKEVLDGCWGANADTSLDAAANADGENGEFVDTVVENFGVSPVVPVRESSVYLFDMASGEMRWDAVSGDATGFFTVAQSWRGVFEIRDGNRLVFTPQSAGFSDPFTRMIVSNEVRDQEPFEWLVGVEGDVMRFEALGELANRENNIDRDGFTFHRFACP